MIPTNQNDIIKDQSAKIGNWIAPRLNKFETILALLFLTVLLCRVLSIHLPIGIIMVLVLTTLSILYFFKAFAPANDENAGGMEIFIDKVVSFGCSVGVVGILFRLENWAGYEVQIIMCSFTSIICLPVILLMKSKKPALTIFSQRVILRLVIIAALGIFLLASSKNDLIKYKLLKEVNMERVE